jgi:hypothetical protein
MDQRHKIEERLQRKEAEIQALEEKVKAARVYVQALRDVLRMLEPGAGEKDESQPAATSGADIVLRSGSAVAQAREIILARGIPVHIGELLVAQGREVTRESRASLTSSLSAYVRRGEIFTRPAPNTFGLIELGHIGSGELDLSEPPHGFGADNATVTQTAEPDDSDVPF